MLESRGGARLALEAGDELGIGAIDLAQDLDRDDAPHAQIDGAKDRRHATAPDGVLHLVAIADHVVHRIPTPPRRQVLAGTSDVRSSALAQAHM